MPDLLDALWDYGATFDAAVADSDAAPFAPLVAVHPSPHRQPVALRLSLAAIVGFAAGAVAFVISERAPEPTASVATPAPSDSITPDPSLAASIDTTTPPVTSTNPPIAWPDDARETLKLLPALEPTWLPDGLGAPEILAFDRGSNPDQWPPGPGWVQVYFDPADPTTMPSLLSPGFDGSQPGTVANGLKSAVVRTTGPGWDVPDLPATYRLIAEGPAAGPSFRRSWSTDNRTFGISIGTGADRMRLNKLSGDVMIRQFAIRGHEAFGHDLDPQFNFSSVVWEEAPGVYASVYGPVSLEVLIRVAEGLTETDRSTYATIIDGLPILTAEPRSAVQFPVVSLQPVHDSMPKLLPTALPAAFEPLGARAIPGATVRGRREQSWMGPELVNPPSVTLILQTSEPMDPDAEIVDVGGRRGGWSPDSGHQVLTVEQDVGGTIALANRGLTDDEVIAFAAGLKHRAKGDGYDATVLPRGLTPFGDGWFGDSAALEMCWGANQRMLCISTRTQKSDGPMIRPNEFGPDVQRLDISGRDAFQQGSTVSWQLPPKSAIDITSYGLSNDELLTIARSVTEVDAETFAAAWAAAGGA